MLAEFHRNLLSQLQLRFRDVTQESFQSLAKWESHTRLDEDHWGTRLKNSADFLNTVQPREQKTAAAFPTKNSEKESI